MIHDSLASIRRAQKLEQRLTDRADVFAMRRSARCVERHGTLLNVETLCDISLSVTVVLYVNQNSFNCF